MHVLSVEKDETFPFDASQCYFISMVQQSRSSFADFATVDVRAVGGMVLKDDLVAESRVRYPLDHELNAAEVFHSELELVESFILIEHYVI